MPLSGLDSHKAITQYGLDRWTRTDGLPQNTVSAITQTRDGYLWFGTEEGLVRFDGVRFTLFNSRNTAALPDQNIRQLLEDHSGTLWIATLSHLVSYHAGKWTSYTLPEGYSNSMVICLHQDANGTLWIGTSTNVGTFQDGAIKDFRDAKGDALKGAWAILETDNHILVFASKGLYRLEKGEYRSICAAPRNASSIAIAKTPDGTIWLGTAVSGLGRLRDGVCSYLTTTDGLTSNYVDALLVDRQGNLWIGTIDGGLHRYSEGRLSTFTAADGLASNQIQCLYEDREGSLWIGTNGGGLNRLRDGVCTTYSTKEGLKGDFVQAVSEGADGSVWIGTNDGGLSRLKDGSFIAHYLQKDGLSNDSVTCLWNDNRGVMWIGTGGGGLDQMIGGRIHLFSRERGYAGTTFFTIYADHSGVLWMGTDLGLCQLKDQQVTRVPGFNGYPLCMKEDRQGTLWIGTNGDGLVGLSKGHSISLTSKEGLSNDIVVCLHEDEEGVLWIGTAGGGLNRLNHNKLSRVTTKDGLFSDSIYQILQDAHGNLWMGCNNGIFCVSKKGLNQVADGIIQSIACISFDESDAMRSRECNGGGQNYAFKARDGSLWFATVDGVVRIDPEQVLKNPLSPPVHVEQMVVNGRVMGGAGIGFPAVLSPGSDRLEFQYSGLSFLKPMKMQFRYRLDGLDAEWVDAGSRREAFYTNVRPGKYVFRVIAANSDGVWNETGASVDFRIKPHFYQTIWFYALIAMTLIGIVHALYRYRMQRLLQLERMRTRIAADLHDEVGAGLTNIAIISEMVQRQLRPDHAEPADQVSTVAETARGLVDSLTDVVWAIDPQLDDIESLIARIRKFSSEVLEAKGITWEMKIPENMPHIRVGSDHRRQILLIFKEAVNNIIRYAACSKVILALELRSGCIAGEIIDDGRGFDSDHVAPRGSGRGLVSMRERAARLGGSLTVVSKPGQGTHISFSIPL